MEGEKFVRISVTDTGEGFPEEQYMQLFEPFKRLVSDRRKSIEGTGIGLSIRGGGVLDGTEVLAIYLSRKTALKIGDVVILINIVIFLAAAYFLSIEAALY